MNVRDWLESEIGGKNGHRHMECCVFVCRSLSADNIKCVGRILIFSCVSCTCTRIQYVCV